MSLTEFQRYFIVVLVSKLVSLHKKLISVIKQTFFEEKKFCMQNLIFFVYNVVLDMLIMNFFSFSLHNFFQKRLKILFLLYDMFLYVW